jgi:hypothetical protein
MRLLRVEWTLAYIKARARCFRPSSIESGFRKAGIYPFDPEILLLALTPPLKRPYQTMKMSVKLVMHLRL